MLDTTAITTEITKLITAGTTENALLVAVAKLSAAIAAEVKRGELRHFYVKQVENREVDKFSHMSDEELEAYIAQQDALLAEIREPKPTIAARSNGRTKH